MSGRPRGRRFLLTSLALALTSGLVQKTAARPLTFADLWRLEGVRRAFAAPGGRYLVLETSAPALASRHFDDDRLILLERTRLFLIDAAARRPVARAVAPGAGVIPLGFSPTGRRLAIGRVEGRHLTLGILRLRDGRLQWPSLEVQAPRNGPSLVWRDEHRLIALAPLSAPDATTFPAGAPNVARLQRLRERQSRGLVSGAVVFTAGRFAGPPHADTQVVGLDLRHGDSRRLASGAFDDLALSATGRVLALTAPAEPPPLAAIRHVGLSDPRPRRRLSLLDLTSGRVSHPCAECDLAPTPLAWAPRRERLLVFIRRPHDLAWSDGAYAVVDPATGAVDRLGTPGFTARPDILAGEGFPAPPGGWRGDTPVVQLVADGEAKAGLFAVSPSGVATASPSATSLLAEDGVRGLLAHRADPGAARRPTSFGGVTLVAGQHSSLVETRDPHGVMALWLRRGSGRALLLRLNAGLSDVDLPLVRPLRRRTSDGEEVTDWLYLPALSSKGGPKPPLVVSPYPGLSYPQQHETQLPGASPPAIVAGLLIAHGYALLLPSLPRPPGGEPATGFTDGVLAAVDGAASLGLVDPDRVAVWGQSFGGFAALLLATRTPRFCAVIAQSAPTDFVSLYGLFSGEARADPTAVQRRDGGVGWSEAGQGAMLGPPWGDPARFVRNSPIFAADKVTAPVLLQVGDQDFFDPGQSEEMFTALRRQDKDVTLMVFPGEGHVLASPPNQAAFYQAAFALLDRAFRQRSERPQATPVPASQPARLR